MPNRRRQPGAPDADIVEAAHGVGLIDQGEGHDILADGGEPPDHRPPADTHELMDRTVARDEGVIADLDMAGQQRPVADHHIVANHAVVGDMGGGHEEAVVADSGRAARLFGAVDGHELPDRIVVADDDPAVDGLPAQDLGIAADLYREADAVRPADPARPADEAVGTDLGSVADHGLVLDDGARPHLDPGTEFRAFSDDRARMNVVHDACRFLRPFSRPAGRGLTSLKFLGEAIETATQDLSMRGSPR